MNVHDKRVRKMTNDAAALLAELRQDHRNMAILLGLLHNETDKIDREEVPDFELLHDIIRYMTVYSDAMHHPKEDLIYDGMRQVQPELVEGLEQVEEDHKEIAALGEALRDDIEAIVAGTEVTRERVVHDARDYMRRLNKHMAWEEEDLFRRADAEIDHLTIDTSHLKATDPIFGEVREASFAKVLQTIQREAQ